ncbi:MAG: hypothetical protein JO119_09320 [Acidobacteria bacterium]|nr:hypothetical protein [Acidobacteriota bacterium]
MEQRVPRYPFSAPAEVVVEESGAKIVARVTELSLQDVIWTPAPLSAETPILLKIYGSEYFEADAMVIYAHPVLGMGIAFRHVNLACQGALHRWLLAAMQTKESE